MSKNLQDDTGRKMQTEEGTSRFGNEIQNEPLNDYTTLIHAAERKTRHRHKRSDQIVSTIKKSIQSRMFRKASFVMAGIVVFATTYSLILPALTLDYDSVSDLPGLSIGQKAVAVNYVDGDQEEHLYRDGVLLSPVVPAVNSVDTSSSSDGNENESSRTVKNMSTPDSAATDESQISARETADTAESVMDETTAVLGTETQSVDNAGNLEQQDAAPVEPTEIQPADNHENEEQPEIIPLEPTAVAESPEPVEETTAAESTGKEDRSNSEENTAENREADTWLSSTVNDQLETVAEDPVDQNKETDKTAGSENESSDNDAMNTETADEHSAAASQEASGDDVETEEPGVDVISEAESADAEATDETADQLEKSATWLENTANTVLNQSVTELTFDGADYQVIARGVAGTAIPEGAELAVTEIVQGSDAAYDDYETAAKEQLSDPDAEVVSQRFFDISFIVNGEKVEPTEGVTVEIHFTEAQEIRADQKLSVVHFADAAPAVSDARAEDANPSDNNAGNISEETEQLNVSGTTAETNTEVAEVLTTTPKMTDDGMIQSITFETGSFSVFGVVYTVDFHGADGYEYSIPGGGYIALSELVKAVGLADVNTETAEPDAGDVADAAEDQSEEASSEVQETTDMAEDGTETDAADRVESIDLPDNIVENNTVTDPGENENKKLFFSNEEKEKSVNETEEAVVPATVDQDENSIENTMKPLLVSGLQGKITVPLGINHGSNVFAQSLSQTIFTPLESSDFVDSTHQEAEADIDRSQLGKEAVEDTHDTVEVDAPDEETDMTANDVEAADVETGEDVSHAEAPDDEVALHDLKIREFIDNVRSAEFSDPELVWVGKVDADTTVGAIKAENGLDVQYSVELTEEQIVEIDSQSVEAEDWVLISLKPFETEETLTVTMKDGEVLTIKVTDAQSTDPLGLDNSTFIVSYNGRAMKAEVNESKLNTSEVSTELGNLFQWKTEYNPAAFEESYNSGNRSYTGSYYWTKGGYYLSADGKYIRVDGTNISLTENKDEATPFRVQYDNNKLNNTDTHSKGRYRFSTLQNEKWGYLNFSNNVFEMKYQSSDTMDENADGFVPTEWLNLQQVEDNSIMPGYVSTWDILGDGIVLKMFDYEGTVNNRDIDTVWASGQGCPSESNYRSGYGVNNGRGLLFSGSGMNGLTNSTVSKINQFTGEWNQTLNVKKYNKMANPGIVQQKLNDAGYPVLNSAYWRTKDRSDNGSLGYLFGAGGQDGVTAYEGKDGKGLQGFLRKDDDGYYYYDSEWNYARMSEDNNEILLYSDTYKKDTATDGIERKEKIGFFPFTDYDNTYREEKSPAQDHYNHQFGTSLHTEFYYPTGGKDPDTNLPMIFEFSGDDDVWVFVDGVLVLDMGGVHQPVKGTIDFSTRTSTVVEYDYNGNETTTIKTFAELFAGSGKNFSTKKMSKHTVDFFYLERGGCDSNCAIRFNLLVTKTLNLKKEIQGLENLSAEQRAEYKNKVFTYEVLMRDPSDPENVRFELYNTADTENTDPAVNYTVRKAADGSIIEQGFPIKDGRVTIKEGETVSIGKLSPSIQYYVQELNNDVMTPFIKPKEINMKGQQINMSNNKSVLDNTVKTWKTGNHNIKTWDTTTILNRLPEVNLDVVKDWKDGQTKDHSSDVVQFTVKATIPGEEAGSNPVTYPVAAIDGKIFTLTSGDEWKRTIEHLPDKTPDGKQITYTVKEIPVEGYTTSVKIADKTTDDDKITEYRIENSPVQLKVKKNWAGDWTDNDKTDVEITLTLGRYKLKDKENLIIHSNVTKELSPYASPDCMTFKAHYTVVDADNSIVASGDTNGEDVVLSLPDGTYYVRQTTEDPANFDAQHTPGNGESVAIEISGTTPKEVTFNSRYTQHTGTLNIASSVTDPSNTFSSTYVVYEMVNDVKGREITRVNYSKSNDQTFAFELPVGTYTVEETGIRQPSGYLQQQTTVDPNPPVQVLNKGDEKTITFTKVYEQVVDSNNSYEIYHAYNNNPLIDSGTVPSDIPVGTKVRLTFYCRNGGWHDRNGREVKYNGQTLELHHTSEQYNGQNCAKFWVDYTLVKDKKLVIKLNADPYGDPNNKFIDNSVTIKPVEDGSNSVSPGVTLQSFRHMAPAKAAAAPAVETKTVTNGGNPPEAEKDTQVYVTDGWTKEVTLSASDTDWEKVITEGIDAADENGNLYYYYIKSATEKNIRTDAEVKIDTDGEDMLTISKENMDDPLTLTNTLGGTGTLRVTKTIAGEITGNEDKSFTVTIQNSEGNYLQEASAPYTFSDTEKTFQVSASRPLEFTELPKGTYTVKEKTDGVEITGYVWNSEESKTEVSVNLSAGQMETAALKNYYEPGTALPATGGPGTMLMFGIGAVVAEITGFGILNRRRKKYQKPHKIMKKR